MTDLGEGLDRLVDLMLISGFLWAGGFMRSALKGMMDKAKATWQREVTKLLIGLMAFIGFGVVILYGVRI